MEINVLGIALAAVSTMAVGFVWYNPKVFGTIWQKAAGVEPNNASGATMGVIFGTSFLLAMIAAFQLDYFVHHDPDGLSVFMHGMYHGMRFALFFGVPILVTNALYERKNLTYMLLNAGYWVISFSLMGGILAVTG